jgi:threonine dehydratase
VGGGGLIGGVALAFRYASPGTQVYAVEPVGFDAMGVSLAKGEITRIAGSAPTICDALQATQPGAAPFAAAQAAGVRGVAVDDASVRAALRFAFEKLKLVLEPSGAVALAAALSGLLPIRGRTAVIYATGGNVAPDRFLSYLAEPAG